MVRCNDTLYPLPLLNSRYVPQEESVQSSPIRWGYFERSFEGLNWQLNLIVRRKIKNQKMQNLKTKLFCPRHFFLTYHGNALHAIIEEKVRKSVQSSPTLRRISYGSFFFNQRSITPCQCVLRKIYFGPFLSEI